MKTHLCRLTVVFPKKILASDWLTLACRPAAPTRRHTQRAPSLSDRRPSSVGMEDTINVTDVNTFHTCVHCAASHTLIVSLQCRLQSLIQTLVN